MAALGALLLLVGLGDVVLGLVLACTGGVVALLGRVTSGVFFSTVLFAVLAFSGAAAATLLELAFESFVMISAVAGLGNVGAAVAASGAVGTGAVLTGDGTPPFK